MYVIKDLIDMKVHDFDPLLSDVHCAIGTNIDIIINKHLANETDTMQAQTTHKQNEEIFKANRRENEKKDNYLKNIDKAILREIEQNTERFGESKDKQQHVDYISEKNSLLLSNAAFETFGKKCLNPSTTKSKKRKTINKNKPWYNVTCKEKRIIFNKAKKKYKLSKSNADFLLMKDKGKDYKHEVKVAYKQYNNIIRTEIRNLRKKSNVREYWEYCKREGHNRQNTSIDFSKFVSFFRNLNYDFNNTNPINMTTSEPNHYYHPNDYLDTDISPTEIVEATKKLKNNKASGIDGISNEYIKSSNNILLPVYVKLFNIIYDQGVIPSAWTTGIIKPIYKQKGCRKDPDNYRPITILSCLGKLFTSILNNRLKSYIEVEHIIGEEQIGFRENYSTIDGVFCLYTLIEMMKKRKYNLFCAFIDLKKCFSSIWREGLWHKINSNMQLGRKMTKSIMSIYKNVKSCIQMYSNDDAGHLTFNSSDMFSCMNGLREGENLSPILYSMYVNDLRNFLEQCNCKGVSVQSVDKNYIDNNIMYYVKMFILMYADDTVIFANTNSDLQYNLDVYNEYCKLWKLNVNVSKTKIMYFGKKRNYNFYIANEEIEIVDRFKYLGVVFSRNGRFSDTINENIEKGRKGLFRLRRTFTEKNLPVDCQIELFEKVIEPILLYGCELWGTENTENIEKFRLRSYKQILKVRNSTPSYIIYGELGKLPLKSSIKTRMIKFWSRLIMGKVDKISYQLFNIMIHDNCSYKWVNSIKNILDETGNSNIWLNQYIEKQTEKYITQNLKDQELQNIMANANMSTKGKIYMSFKINWKLEPYLSTLDTERTISLIKFRTGNHRFPIETGRYKNIPIKDRKCRFCNTLGDEFHYLLECNRFNSSRAKYIDNFLY